MTPTLDRLSELAEAADRAHGMTTHALDLLRLEGNVARAQEFLATVQSKLNHINRQLVIMGATDNRLERTRMVIAERDPSLPPLADDSNVPLHLLSSEKAQRAAQLMRDAAEAVLAMEHERGIEDGMAERLGDYADALLLETFGPKGLGE
jgi:ATP phosphoribosyltransferase